MTEAVDMSQFIEARSDQLNSDDLIGRTITVTITKVVGCDGDQPIAIYYEGDNGKPFKPCKTIRRVLCAVWGQFAADYVGRSMTLYRDDAVTFGGLQVGGIRISHMSHLEKETVVVVLKSKGKKAGVKVLPLVKSATPGTGNYAAALDQLKSLARPGNMDALGAKWQEIGADARKALAAELPALKAACDAPAEEDVPFDETPPPKARTLAEQLEGPPTEHVDETTGEITDVHPGTAIADAIIDKLQDCIVIGAVDAVMAERATDIAAMLDEDGIRVEVAASKRRDAIEAAKVKAAKVAGESLV